MKPKKVYTKICPVCGSTEVHVDFSNPVVWVYGTPPQYKCADCSHMAPSFPEVSKDEIEEFRKKMTKDRKVDPEKGLELVSRTPGANYAIFFYGVVIILFIIMLFFISIFWATVILAVLLIYIFWRIKWFLTTR